MKRLSMTAGLLEHDNFVISLDAVRLTGVWIMELLEGMATILVTNDDGIHAEGITALKSAIPNEWHVVTVAPEGAMSQCGHRVTTDTPLRVARIDDHHYTVAGTPADCVRLAVTSLLDERPDWVLSGINHGGNMGADIYISGTVAAVREAAFLGIPAIGFSHYKRREWAFHWDVASRWATAVMSELLEEELRAGEYWNVNFPHLAPEEDNLPTRVHCPPSRKPLPLQYTVEPGANGLWDFRYSGVYANREHEDGSDVDHCFGGSITVSRLTI